MKTANHQQHMRCPGFTLTETLIVVALIAALAALAYYGGRRMVTYARIVESTANLRSLAAANTCYLADHGVYCPADDRFNNRNYSNKNHHQWRNYQIS